MSRESPITLQRNLSNPRTDIEREIAAWEPWFHNLHLPGGVQTAPDHPLGDFPRYQWQHMEPYVPKDLSGCSALDIGCNAGVLQLPVGEARGASHRRGHGRQVSQPGRLECPKNITVIDRDLMLDSSWPKMAFIENSLDGDPTNWWVPNQPAIEAMLHSCGWRAIRYMGEEIYVCQGRSAGLPMGAMHGIPASLST